MNIAAKPTRDRIANDYYPTEAAFTELLFSNRCPVRFEGAISEPCAGQRQISDVLSAQGLTVHSSDILDGPGNDATQPEYWTKQPPIDWVITNPPFKLATPILQHAYAFATRGVCFFLRLTYLEPCPDRAGWLQRNSDQLRLVMPVNPRPIFRSDTNKTDSVTCAWMLWDKSWSWTSIGVTPPFNFAAGHRDRDNIRHTIF